MIARDIEQQVEIAFGAAAPRAMAVIEQFVASGGAMHEIFPSDRVARCAVHLAAGDEEALGGYLRAALTDWRDVIYWAEYDRNGERVRDFNNPFPRDNAE